MHVEGTRSENPFWDVPEISVGVADLNNQEFSRKEEIEEIKPQLQAIGKKIIESVPFSTSPALHCREVIAKIKDPKIQKLMNRILRPVIYPSTGFDVVCGMSQGKLDETHGPKACSTICAYAAVEFLKHSGKQPIITEPEMVEVMKKGIKFYKDKGYEDYQEFSQVLVDKNKREDKKKSNKLLLESFIPTQIRSIAPDSIIFQGLGFPIQGSVGDNLKGVLTTLEEQAITHKHGVCGVLTCNGETILVGFLKSGQVALFDSHGRTYKGESLGASLLTFSDIDALTKHLETNLFKNKDDPFDLVMLRKQGKALAA